MAASEWKSFTYTQTQSSCAFVERIDYGSFISEDVGRDGVGLLGNVVILRRQ